MNEQPRSWRDVDPMRVYPTWRYGELAEVREVLPEQPTEADLARWEALARAAFDGPALSTEPGATGALVTAAGRVPALVAAVRQLREALDRATEHPESGPHSECVICGGFAGPTTDHDDDCPAHPANRSRLLGRAAVEAVP